MSKEEISSLYHAIKEPDNFASVFKSLGLSEDKFDPNKVKTQGLLRSDKEKILKQLLSIVVDLDATPELPEIKPKTDIEALISPRKTEGIIGPKDISSYK
jgi:hypothetical protein